MNKFVLNLFFLSLSCNIIKPKDNSDEESCKAYNSKENLNELIVCLREGAPENIREDEKVRAYLDKHKIYVSLTTSPERLALIEPVLKTVN